MFVGRFPFICKSAVSAGQSDSHIMTVVFNKEGLSDMSAPILLQEYINHYGQIYKVFVLGDKVFHFHISPHTNVSVCL